MTESKPQKTPPPTWPEARSREGTCEKCNKGRRVARVHEEGETKWICAPCAYPEQKAPKKKGKK